MAAAIEAEVRRANGLLKQRQFAQALECAQGAASTCCTHGDHIEGMRLLAQIGMKLDVAGRRRVPARERAGASRRIIMPPATTTRSVLLQRTSTPALARRWRSCCDRPGQPGLSHHACDRMHGIRRLRARPCRCIAAPGRDARRTAELHLSIGACAEDARPAAPEAIESYRAAAAVTPGLRRRLLEPRQSEDLSLHGRRNRAHARRGGGARTFSAGRSLSSVFRARQGARGSRRVRGVVCSTTNAATR
jgi:hypothetical protein